MDPSGQEKNPYAYAACNPINGKDPSGLACAGSIYSGVVSAAGLVASTITLVAGAPTVLVSVAGVVGFIASSSSPILAVRPGRCKR